MPSIASGTITVEESVVTDKSIISIPVHASGEWDFLIFDNIVRIDASKNENRLTLRLPRQGFFRILFFLVENPSIYTVTTVYKSSASSLAEFPYDLNVSSLWGKIADCYIPEKFFEVVWQGLVGELADIHTRALTDFVDYALRRNRIINATENLTVVEVDLDNRFVEFDTFKSIGMVVVSSDRAVVCSPEGEPIFAPKDLIGLDIGGFLVDSVDGYWLRGSGGVPDTPTTLTLAVVGGRLQFAGTLYSYFFKLTSGSDVYWTWGIKKGDEYVLTANVPDGAYTVDVYTPHLKPTGVRFSDIVWGPEGLYFIGFPVLVEKKGLTVCDKALWVPWEYSARKYPVIRFLGNLSVGDRIQFELSGRKGVARFWVEVKGVLGDRALVSPLSGDGTFSDEEWNRIASELKLTQAEQNEIVRALRGYPKLRTRFSLAGYNFSLSVRQVIKKDLNVGTYVPGLMSSEPLIEGAHYVQYSERSFTAVSSGNSLYVEVSKLWMFRPGDEVLIGDKRYTILEVSDRLVLDGYEGWGDVEFIHVRPFTEVRFEEPSYLPEYWAPSLAEDNRPYVYELLGFLFDLDLEEWKRKERSISYTEACLSVARTITREASPEDIRFSASAFLGLPTAVGKCYIEALYPSEDFTLVQIRRYGEAFSVMKIPPARTNAPNSGVAPGVEAGSYLEDAPLTNIVSVRDYLSGAPIKGLKRYHTYEVLVNPWDVDHLDADRLFKFLRNYSSPARAWLWVTQSLTVYSQLEGEDSIQLSVGVLRFDDIGHSYPIALKLDAYNPLNVNFGDAQLIPLFERFIIGVFNASGNFIELVGGGLLAGRDDSEWFWAADLLRDTNNRYVITRDKKIYEIIAADDDKIYIQEVSDNPTNFGTELPQDGDPVIFFIVKQKSYNILTAYVVTAYLDGEYTVLVLDREVYNYNLSVGDVLVYDFGTSLVAAVGSKDLSTTHEWNKIWVKGDLTAIIGQAIQFVRLPYEEIETNVV